MVGKKPARSGIPLWILAVIIPAGLLLVCCAGGIGFVLFLRGVSSKGAGGQVPTSDFDGLGRWCEQSLSDIDAANAANPVRGKELQDKHLEELRGQLVGKEIRWRLKVTRIDPDGVLVDSCYSHKVKQPWKIRGEERWDDVPLVAARFEITKKLPPPGKKLDFYEDGYVDDISPQKLHDLSVGGYVTVVGRVEDVSFDSPPLFYRIKVANVKIE
jgi:hypothetical protein